MNRPTCQREKAVARSRCVYGRQQQPIGTFVMGYGQTGDEQRFAVPALEFAADAVGALLQRELDEAA